jgi:hypothetical protein
VSLSNYNAIVRYGGPVGLPQGTKLSLILVFGQRSGIADVGEAEEAEGGHINGPS